MVIVREFILMLYISCRDSFSIDSHSAIYLLRPKYPYVLVFILSDNSHILL